MPAYESAQYNTRMGGGYVDPSDKTNKEVKQLMDWFYNSNYPANSTLWMQGSVDKRFKVGDQTLYYSLYGNYSQNMQRFFFNLIRRHINMIAGYQRKNRKSTITVPIHPNDDTLADDYNTVLRFCEDRDGFQEYLSQSFEGALDTGMTLLYLYPDYTFDPISGDLFSDSVSYNNYLIDQFFRKQDLSDCNGIWRRRWVNKTGAKQLLPGYAEEIDKMKPGGMKDGRFPLQAELNNIAMSNLFTYDEFHYRTTREATMILDPYTEEAVEWEQDAGDGDDMMERALAQQPWLVVKKMQVPTVKLVIKVSDHVVYHGANLLNIDSYPCIPSICYHEPDMQAYAWKWQGIIRNLRDPQFLYNMRKVIELQILQSSVNAGWIFPVDAVTDIKAFRQNDGGQGFLIPLKAGRQPNEIQRIEPVAIPQSLLELSASLSEDITKISGVNEELLGAATDDKSGILSMLRQGAGLVTLQTIFDKLDYTQRLYGKIRLQAIRKNFSKGKIRNILGHDPDPRFWTSHSQKYSIAVEEGNYSTSQRQMELQQLLHFKELGMGINDKSILRAAFLTNKKQIIADMEEQNAQQAQAQQQQAQVEQERIQSEVMERFSKSQMNIAKVDELHAEADHKRSQSELDAVKAMIELEDMDLNQIRSTLELSQFIKALNAQTSEQSNELVAQGAQNERSPTPQNGSNV